MSEYSKKEREHTFNVIREFTNPKMCETIENCHKITRCLGLPKQNIPNIIVAYNNRILELEKEFNKVGIDFYDNKECETRFIIENRMQGSILLGKEALTKYFVNLKVSKEQAKDFVDSYKHPTKFQKVFKKAKYEPKKSILNFEQKKNSTQYLKEYITHYNKVANFSIQNDIIEAILFYRILVMRIGEQNFDSRIDTIDSELKKLGYNSIKDIVYEQIEIQNLSLDNINHLNSVAIPAKIITFEKK